MISIEGAVFMAATAVGIEAIESVDALSVIAPAKPRVIPVLRDDIGFLRRLLLLPRITNVNLKLNGHRGGR